MPPGRALVCYLTTVFVGGALLAPFLHDLARWLAQAWPAFEWLAAHPFRRFVVRSFQIVAIGGLWPLARAVRFASWRDLGLGDARSAPGLAARGFLVATVPMTFCALGLLASGTQALQPQAEPVLLARFLALAVLSAVVVGVLEEILFRGFLFGGLRKSMRLPGALLLSSTVYATVHFFARPSHDGPVSWYSGLEVLGGMLSGLVQVDRLVPAFLNLALAGVILALAYERTGRLWFPMGLHSGWIFCQKAYWGFTQPLAGAKGAAQSSSLLLGHWLPLAALAGTLWWVTRQAPCSAGGPAPSGPPT